MTRPPKMDPQGIKAKMWYGVGDIPALQKALGPCFLAYTTNNGQFLRIVPRDYRNLEIMDRDADKSEQVIVKQNGQF